ncbi:MAG TPA: D-aminoacyl-tRNA deacylase [Polyangiaceae bacterium]|jgi:D-tyrosyl-tRNA(Tyr) deacylase
MRAVLQRVASARVEVDGEVVGAIERGLLVYLGFGQGDTTEDRAWILAKIAGARIFDDGAGKMNRSVVDVAGALLLVSQFTLYADMRRGRRPSFQQAMAPLLAEDAYRAALAEARAFGVPVEAGRFRADMRVVSVNDGPVTLWLDSSERGAAPQGRAEDASEP